MFNKLTKSYLINSLVDVHDLLFTHPDLKKNIELKDKYNNERIFILGSGSSILLYDLKVLSNECVMTQNSFHMHNDISDINPTFHCVVPYYQSDKEHSIWVDYINDMKVRMPDSLFIWGLNTKSLIDKYHEDLRDKSYYLRTRYNLLTLNKAKVNISKTIMTIPTVLTQCLTVAIYLGFKEIYLLGFDLDQICHTNDQTYGRFYGMSKITETEFEKDANQKLDVETTDGWYTWWLMNKQFFLIKHFADQNNINIVNGTKGGILSYFKREPIENIVGQEILLEKK
tara:strand:+ start:355 stop:1206 length:852 start_codon:yes stop_codon:yes gene_type:complete